MSDTGPLSGLIVVELTVHRAAPFCGSLLSDMGAEVIKIERPNVGDPARGQGTGPEKKSAYFMVNNRGKRSITLDLKNEAGQEAALGLLEDADVFIENFAYGVPERLGLDYDRVTDVNEDIIYASVKGYGETGPLKHKKGLDLILQAEGGIMSVTGPEEGAPVKVGQAIGDLGTGLFAAIGILARLWERDGTEGGSGGKFDVGLFDTIVRLMDEYITVHSMTGEVPGTQGTAHQFTVPYQLFETEDGYVVTGVASDDKWDDFVDMLGREEIREYQTNDERFEHRKEIISVIEDEFSTRPTEYWMEQLTEYGFPNGPLNDIEDVVNHEQAEARGLVEKHDDPDWGDCLLPGHPIHFPDYDTSIDNPAPRLGQHTESVLADVADEKTIERWRDAGAFGDE